MGKHGRWWATAAALAFGAGLSACASGGCDPTRPPVDLPTEPVPCAQYCKVWVPPTYRKVPRLVAEPSCPVEVPQTVERIRTAEICVKPRQEKLCRTPDTRCEQVAVQVKPGGYQWQQVGDCWRYVYVPPCYEWTNKVVGEDSIEYATETPPEYRTVAWTEQETVMTTVTPPARYRTEWVDELYEPGHWEWRMTKPCDGCVQPGACPTLPFTKRPCTPPTPNAGVTPGCDRCN